MTATPDIDPVKTDPESTEHEDLDVLSALLTCTAILADVHTVTAQLAALPPGLSGQALRHASIVSEKIATSPGGMPAAARKPIAAGLIAGALHQAIAAVALLAVERGIDPRKLGIEADVADPSPIVGVDGRPVDRGPAVRLVSPILGSATSAGDRRVTSTLEG